MMQEPRIPEKDSSISSVDGLTVGHNVLPLWQLGEKILCYQRTRISVHFSNSFFNLQPHLIETKLVSFFIPSFKCPPSLSLSRALMYFPSPSLSRSLPRRLGVQDTQYS